MPQSDVLRDVALAEFAKAGFLGTSLQCIADAAGVSKSAVLYHFDSKEALLEAAIAPAVDRLGALTDTYFRAGPTAEASERFLVGFIDLLLEHRRAVHLFINQSAALADVPAIARATRLVRELAGFSTSNASSTEQRLRFGMALGGAAYTLGTADDFGVDLPPVDEMRAALRVILTELLATTAAAPEVR